MNLMLSDNIGILCLSCNVKKHKTTAKLSKKSRNQHCSKFFMVSSMTSTLILLLFLTVAQHESGTRKTISWSVTVYNNTLSSQCNRSRIKGFCY
jgi:hypothetical protein